MNRIPKQLPSNNDLSRTAELNKYKENKIIAVFCKTNQQNH